MMAYVGYDEGIAFRFELWTLQSILVDAEGFRVLVNLRLLG